jgi:hypothetical protein
VDSATDWHIRVGRGRGVSIDGTTAEAVSRVAFIRVSDGVAALNGTVESLRALTASRA